LPQRKIRVTTPLYEVTFDSRGAVATSWIVRKVKRSDGTWRELYSAGSTKNNPKPLELILSPPAGVAAEQLFRPFQIVTGDATADSILASRNFKVTGANSESGDATIDVPTGSRQVADQAAKAIDHRSPQADSVLVVEVGQPVEIEWRQALAVARRVEFGGFLIASMPFSAFAFDS